MRTNDTNYDFSFRPVTALFEEQVRNNPDRTAVIAAGKRLTYRELNQSANCVANVLIDKGVRAETIVGVMLERDSTVYVARQGILKSGGAFTSIDPEYPDDRIRYILEDSGAAFLITTGELAAQHSGLLNELSCTVLLVEALLESDNTENPNRTINEQDLCYCIYTSGSTGKPKGVMIEHGNLANFVNAMLII